MNRQTLILCLSVLSVMILGVGVAVALLYSGTGQTDKGKRMKVADSDRCPALCAVPSDAVLVATYSDAEMFPAMRKSGMVMSLHHYSGKLNRLYVLPEGRDTSAVAAVVSEARRNGLLAERDGGFVLLSDSETLLKSSRRHIAKGVSVLNAAGFREAMEAVDGQDMLYISNCHFGKLLPLLMQRPYSSYAGFMERLADWCVFSVNTESEQTSLAGTLTHDSDASDFMTVFEKMKPGTVSVSEVLPSYTLFASSIPVRDLSLFVDAYQSYLDSRQRLQIYNAAQARLSLAVPPLDLLRRWEVREVAVASFKAGTAVETVNLIKVGSPELSTLFQGTDVTSLKGYQPAVHEWGYPSMLASVFGDFFERKDETCFTYIDGWVVTGSRAAVEEYSSGRALEYTLRQYMADAGQDDLLADRQVAFVSYFSFTEDESGLPSIFRKTMLNDLTDICGDAEYCPFVLSVSGGRPGPVVCLDLFRLNFKKTKAPVFERDTVVAVPKGPFQVKNSGTGKMNRFYQNSHNSLCLSQDGKDLWGVPFDMPICGRAGTVDYYTNGKLQILFCAGSRLYLIDRLGRYVSGFPLDLGKEVLLGPDIYDFNGARKYNVMILHKDNTVEMYNLKGQKPAAWKGMTASETIKNLPERIVVGGSSFWVVRTSIQTLIYPFYGGDPLTVFTGDHMIRPDSEVKVKDAASVEFVCYDGKIRTAQLK